MCADGGLAKPSGVCVVDGLGCGFDDGRTAGRGAIGGVVCGAVCVVAVVADEAWKGAGGFVVGFDGGGGTAVCGAGIAEVV